MRAERFDYVRDVAENYLAKGTAEGKLEGEADALLGARWIRRDVLASALDRTFDDD